MKRSTDKTVFWKGVSQFSIQGYEIFEMSDFPFDRQLINLELLEFVWRDKKDTHTFDFSMKLVYLRVTTESMLPEWDPYPASVSVEQLIKTGDREDGPSSASRFQVKLRVERQSQFFIMQVYLVTLLIIVITTFPLALPPNEDYVGTRLGAYGTGVLTLVAYKYGIADQLPRVPYATYTDKYLARQIITVVVISIEAIVAFHLVANAGADETIVQYVELAALVIIILTWIGFFTYTAKFKKRKSWETVSANQEQALQIDPTNYD